MLDISDPGSPLEIANHRTTGGHAGSIAIDGDYAYVGIVYADEGLEVVDISDPANPNRAAYVVDPYNVWGVTFDDRFIYMACNQGLMLSRKSDLD